MKTCIFRARSFVLPLALVGAFPVLAQSPENPSLGPIVVTATRVAQPLSELGPPVRFVRKPATSTVSYSGRAVQVGIASGFRSVG